MSLGARVLAVCVALVATACSDVGGVATTLDTTTTTAAVTTTSRDATTTSQATTTSTEPATTTTEATSTTSPGANDRTFGYVGSAEGHSDGSVMLEVDFASFLTGEAATEAARAAGEIGEGETVPNDFYIVDDGLPGEELRLASDARVEVQACFVEGECVTTLEITVDEWLGLVAGEPVLTLPEGFQWYGAGALPYWFTLDPDGTVVILQEQYLP